MSVDKMVKKTIEVLDKQRELNQLIIEMKEEVKKIEQQNLALNSENQKLRERIEKSQLHPRLKEDPVTIEKVPKKPEIQVAHETPKVEIPIEVKKPVDPIKPVQTKPQSDARNGLVEFFLGKNVIAKIAAILMVLAVLTFGQIAYIDWLNNVGRYVLILSIGFIFLGLGYLFEFKKIDVYSHIFYIAGLSIILIDNFLGMNQYELYGNYVFMYILIPLSIFPLLYFFNKRHIFLDFTLTVYHMVLVVVPVFIFSDLIILPLPFILITILLISSGFSLCRSFVLHVSNSNYLTLFEYLLLFILTVLVIINGGDLVNTTTVSYGHIINIFYQIFVLALFYLINFKTMKIDDIARKFIVLVATTASLVIIGIGLTHTVNELFGIINFSLYPLITGIIFIPIYMYHFKNNEERLITNLYLTIAAIFSIVFAFVAERQLIDGVHYPIEHFLKAIILSGEMLIIYFFSRVTKDKIQRYITYLYMIVITTYTIIHFSFNEALNIEQYPFFLSIIVSSIFMYLLYVLIPSHKKENELFEEKDIITLFVFASLFPLFISLGRLIDTDVPIILTTVGFYIIGFRYMLQIRVFQTRYKEELISFLNIIIIIIVIWANFYYFDHNFAQFKDVFKIFYLGLLNVYVIQSIRELYKFTIAHYDFRNENTFILFYIKGAAIHAVFITQFINFSFDKVILSSYYIIAAAVAVLFGFRRNYLLVRKIGLGVIYFSLAKFFIYDFWRYDFTMYVRFISYFTLAIVLFAISALYSYLEKKYGLEEHIDHKDEQNTEKYKVSL